MLAMSRVDCSRIGECNRQYGLLSIVYVNWQEGGLDGSCEPFSAVTSGCVCSGQASLYAYSFDLCVVSTGGSLCLIAGRPGRFTRLADFCVFLA